MVLNRDLNASPPEPHRANPAFGTIATTKGNFVCARFPFFRKNMTEMHAINGLRNRGNPTQRSGLPRFFSISM
jgi:hypothetical protein